LSRLGFFHDILSSVFDRGSTRLSALDDRTIDELCRALLTERGEISGNQLSRAILDRFADADTDTQGEIFAYWLHELDIDPDRAFSSVKAYTEKKSVENWRHLVADTEPARRELFRRLNRVSGATGELVAMRENLFTHLKHSQELARVDTDFENLFSAWFNRGFLVLRQIDWNTPASILEKIIQYEAVHAINDWDDLRGRLEPADRHCFAFFHPAMPDDPLIFVEVALTQSLPDSIQSMLSSSRQPLTADEADTAVFYSISNCQPGLRGVSFGNFLIKQVADELANQFPNLKTFRTLSPVPGFMQWVNSAESDSDSTDAVKIARQLSEGSVSTEGEHEMELVRALAAKYLIRVRGPNDEPLDPVARFHLGNGASLSQIVAAADLSAKGLNQSAGVMVSYLYDLGAIESNHESYANERRVTASRELENLLSS